MINKKKQELLCIECSKEIVDWEIIRALVLDLKSIINDKIEEDNTLLSLLYEYCESSDGSNLAQLTKLFLECGYDVHANKGFNGGICLHKLCWSTYDHFILDAAELLLDAGADPFYRYEDDGEASGVLNSISWKLGYWTAGDLACANLFEAYYQMIEAAQKGEEYHGIHTVSKCIGKSLQKIEKATLVDHDIILLWFEDVPLVVSQYVDFVVNPYTAARAKNRCNINASCKEALGAKITDILFLSPSIAALNFDNGKRLVFSQDFSNTGTCLKSARICISESRDYATDLLNKQIDRILFDSGHQYSDSCRSYAEDAVYLQSESDLYLISSIGEEYSDHYILCQPLDRAWAKDLTRTLKQSCFVVDKIERHSDQTVKAFRLSSSDKHLYLIATQFRGVKLMLESKPTEDVYKADDYTTGERIDFISS